MKELKTYQDFKRKKEKLEKKLFDEEDKCAKEGLSFDSMLEQTKNLREQIFEMSQQMRLKQDPTIVFDKQWKGNLMTIEEFVEDCKNGSLIDSDGYGYYATEIGKSDILIYPSDVIEDKFRKDFSHVIWFNK